MIETVFTAFTTFFATVGPIESAVLFATLTPNLTKEQRRAISIKASLIATLIVLTFALLGEPILRGLGVSHAALQAAGGVILFFIALDMIFARPSGGISLSVPEGEEAKLKAEKSDIAVFPLATPILAGPGAMSGAIILTSNARGDVVLQAAVISTLLAVMALTFVLLLVAQEIKSWIGLTAQNVIMRVFGILLAALAMQSMFNGIAASGLVAP